MKTVCLVLASLWVLLIYWVLEFWCMSQGHSAYGSCETRPARTILRKYSRTHAHSWIRLSLIRHGKLIDFYVRIIRTPASFSSRTYAHLVLNSRFRIISATTEMNQNKWISVIALCISFSRTNLFLQNSTNYLFILNYFTNTFEFMRLTEISEIGWDM